MDKFFFSFLDTLPIFLCVADEVTKLPVYYNKLAAECLENMTDEKRIEFIREMNQKDSLKYCTKTTEQERGKWYNMESMTCQWLDGKQCILIMGVDHSKTILLEENSTVEANTDFLTGIDNRQLGLKMLEKFVNEKKKKDAPPFTMCFLDLDDLKYINDRYGHSAGDLYVLTVVDLVKQSIRQSDVFARMGGDEFLVIFPKCRIEIVTSILKEVDKLLDAVNKNNDPVTQYSISYGVLEIGPEDTRSMETLLADASAEMYKMKGEYKKTRILPS